MKYLITGGCGFLGSNIAAALIKNKSDVTIFDSLERYGSQDNLLWLKTQGEFNFVHGDIRNCNDVENLIKNSQPDTIFHLAGQVAMTTSIENPRKDFEVNALGSFNILESVRKYSPYSGIIYSSTNKVYGDLERYTYTETDTRYICNEFPNGFDESIPLDFHSPYGNSKGSADQYMLDYSRIYSLRTIVYRHSSMFGGRQYATENQGWIGWFVNKALEIKSGSLTKNVTISGNGKQVRDILFADDMVSLYIETSKNFEKCSGRAFNIGGGINNSLSLLELFTLLEDKLDISFKYNKLPPRQSDQKVFVADISEIKNRIGWKPKIEKECAIERMIEWLR